jgi:hypothetical protein
MLVQQAQLPSMLPARLLPNADTFIQKTKKLYMDTQTQRNLAKLNNDLSEVRMHAQVSASACQGPAFSHPPPNAGAHYYDPQHTRSVGPGGEA